MKSTLLAFGAIAAALIFSSSANAETCKGKWGGSAATSVMFKSGNNARYCYESQCWNVEWLGDKAKNLTFRIGDGGATVDMKAKKGGYSAIWRNGTNSARASLTCG